MARAALSAREDAAWRGFLRLRTALVGHLARELAADSGLTEAEYAILVALVESPGHRIRARDLALGLQWERSRLSHQIARMEDRGSVRRMPCADDARGFDLVLTDVGFAAIKAATPAHLGEVRHCFADVLTDEQLDALIGISSAIMAHLDDAHGDESCAAG